MKMLKKLALVSAVSMISAGAFAMEALDEETMAATTGQDGITINIIPGVIAGGAGTETTAALAATAFNTKFGFNAKFNGTDLNGATAGGFGYKGLVIKEIRIHDDDGATGAYVGAPTAAGVIVIGGGPTGLMPDSDATVVYADGSEPIVLDIDSSGNGGAPLLNVKITTPTLLGVKTGDIYVATSSDTVNAGDGMQDTVGNTATTKVKILDALHMSVGGVALNVQLGNEHQGEMIAITGALTGGLSISNFGLNDAGGTAGVSSGGKIAIAEMGITDAGAGNNLSLDVSVDVVDDSVSAHYNGLVITLNTLGTASGIDIDMENVALGKAGTADLGDVQLLGLNLNGSKLVIRGH